MLHHYRFPRDNSALGTYPLPMGRSPKRNFLHSGAPRRAFSNRRSFPSTTTMAPPPVTHNSHYFSPTPSDLSNAVTQGTPQRPIRLAAECGTGCVARVSETKPRSLRHRKKHNIVARANGGELRIRTTPRWLRLGHPECAHVAPVHMVCRMLTVSVALQKRCPSRPFFDETVYRISWIYCDIATSAALPHCHLRHPSEPQFDELWHASSTPKKR